MILSVRGAPYTAENLLADGCWVRTSGDKKGCTCYVSQPLGGLSISRA